MKVIETERLIIREANLNDVGFIYRLLNDPLWKKYIGDKNIKTTKDAENYIVNVPLKMYAQHGFGLFITELKNDQTPVGYCGLIRRADLDDVDIGFAFLPEYREKGYAYESALAAMSYARKTHDLKRLVAITLSENISSVNLIKKLGFHFERSFVLESDDEELDLYAIELQ